MASTVVLKDFFPMQYIIGDSVRIKLFMRVIRLQRTNLEYGCNKYKHLFSI